MSADDPENNPEDGGARGATDTTGDRSVDPAARFGRPDGATEERSAEEQRPRLVAIPFARPSGRTDGETENQKSTAEPSGAKAAAEDAEPAHSRSPDGGSEARNRRAGGSARAPAPSEDKIAEVGYDDIRTSCIAAREQRRKVIVVLGLAATGKSFLVKRLRNVLGDDYTCSTMRGLPRSAGPQAVDRTKEVLLYRFNHAEGSRSPRSFDVYDVPGDKFTNYMVNGWTGNGEIGAEDTGMLRLFYAIFAFADAMIIIAPALQVLEPWIYDGEGDDLEEYQRILVAADSKLPLPTRTERDIRAQNIERFVDSLDPMTRIIALLKDRLPRKRKIDGEALDKAIDEVFGMGFGAIMNSHPKSLPLALPAMLLLSRADELRRRLKPELQDRFDRDPALYLLRQRSAYFHHLARRFAAFTVDFLTAESREEPGTPNFEPARPSYGANHLIDEWLLPSINHCRRPFWWRVLQRPYVAARLRSWLDPDFGAAWKRKH